jgi:hypothetical protein
MDDDFMIFPPNQNESSAPAHFANVSSKLILSKARNQPKFHDGDLRGQEHFGIIGRLGAEKLCLDIGPAGH